MDEGAVRVMGGDVIREEMESRQSVWGGMQGNLPNQRSSLSVCMAVTRGAGGATWTMTGCLAKRITAVPIRSVVEKLVLYLPRHKRGALHPHSTQQYT